ncbi:mevalonate kinase [Actinacidiphila rubida]|uniref:mevalonate kinase n=1 Tax=Actinacidiphila rubida TaxID=310780 RepID=A0A1H8R704_9ACTN|nr:mevalonate kinase [Actinacidiphila rubida]SEO62131.1 mevalonate kinase [Actinacidiphila rubida]
MTRPSPAEEAGPARRVRAVGVGRAHAKAIVLGEHAVVYGAPALAVPVPQLAVTASAGWSAGEPGDSDGDQVTFTMTGSPSRPIVTQAFAGLGLLTGHFTRAFGAGALRHLDVIIDGGIPHGRGLGSSAAYARAVVLALADLYDRQLSDREVFALVQRAEDVAHGRSSGVDATAVGARGPIWFQAGTAQPVRVGCEALFVIADSGTAGRTKDAVQQLRERLAARPGAEHDFVTAATDLTHAGRDALARGETDRLGGYLTHYHRLLSGAGLSTTGIDALVAAALDAGSLGAKITGGGLGGCMLALVPPVKAGQVTRRLHQAGAVQTWVVPLREIADHGH